jgi:hypothetical protein
MFLNWKSCKLSQSKTFRNICFSSFSRNQTGNTFIFIMSKMFDGTTSGKHNDASVMDTVTNHVNEIYVPLSVSRGGYRGGRAGRAPP